MNWDPRLHYLDATKSLHKKRTDRLKALHEWHVQEFERLKTGGNALCAGSSSTPLPTRRYHHRQMVQAIERELQRRNVHLQVSGPQENMVEPRRTKPVPPESAWNIELKIEIASAMRTRIENDLDSGDYWDEILYLRAICEHIEHGKVEAWTDFVDFVSKRPRFAWSLIEFLWSEGYLDWRYAEDRKHLVFVPGKTGEFFFEAVAPLARTLEAAAQ